jgi:hypothetical protein
VLLRKCLTATWNEGTMETRHYRDLQVWQRSMSLAREIYAVTDGFPRNEQFGLASAKSGAQPFLFRAT